MKRAPSRYTPVLHRGAVGEADSSREEAGRDRAGKGEGGQWPVWVKERMTTFHQLRQEVAAAVGATSSAVSDDSDDEY
jgi:hypothetical protein